MDIIVSLLLGLAAWILPLMAIGLHKRPALFCAGSFLLCNAVLAIQLFNVQFLCEKGDLAAVDDTIAAVCFAVTVLLAVAVVLNGAALAVAGRKRKKLVTAAPGPLCR